MPEAVVRLRRRQAKNLFCLPILANGTPMFVAGDEFLNTQRGNNDPLDTARDSPDDVVCLDDAEPVTEPPCRVEARSVVVLVRC
ncbi:hypothetical protein [Azospirillum sp. INR13]|uniref:hypothetical protein n=1 Tax=Azospirillum sp. INR13 TaxID=2596919 RepID=UPI00189204DF|nr:hypothetical protein [Azospirillum sp. INR13]